MLPIYLDDSSMMTALEKALRSEGFEVMTPVEAGTVALRMRFICDGRQSTGSSC